MREWDECKSLDSEVESWGAPAHCSKSLHPAGLIRCWTSATSRRFQQTGWRWDSRADPVVRRSAGESSKHREMVQLLGRGQPEAARLPA